MSAIEGEILSLMITEAGGRRGIEIRVFIPEPIRPGIEDPCFYDTEREYEEAVDKNKWDHEKYQADLENMYSLCLEEISIFPHREIKTYPPFKKKSVIMVGS
jgi:hypothetical protein